jgi:hypothetical protein
MTALQFGAFLLLAGIAATECRQWRWRRLRRQAIDRFMEWDDASPEKCTSRMRWRARSRPVRRRDRERLTD